MRCTEARERILVHARGELLPSEAGELTQHLEMCAACAKEMERATWMLAVARAANPRQMEEHAEALLRRAVAARASDLHVDPEPDGLVVRFREDGLLKEVERHPLSMTRPLVDAFLRLAGLPAEAIEAGGRRPATGRIHRNYGDEEFSLRVATFPLLDGPKLVVRMYAPGNRRITLEELGLSREHRALLEGWRSRPNGLILIAGRPGTGKTTTQYALLELRASEGSNTLALERHPVARIPRVHHAALDPAEGLGHAEALRALMRGLDPDVVMVDEVPDAETARQLPDVAITGHLVIAGVEAGGAVDAIRRLLDMGADPWTLSQTLVGASAQRLARRICPHCRVERRAPPLGAAQGLEWKPEAVPPSFAGEGCERCRKRGFLGRVAFYELLEVTPAAAARIAENAPAAAIAAAAGAALSPFLDDARRKVADGLVTVEEAGRVVRQA